MKFSAIMTIILWFMQNINYPDFIKYGSKSFKEISNYKTVELYYEDIFNSLMKLKFTFIFLEIKNIGGACLLGICFTRNFLIVLLDKVLDVVML